jgi:hypothetical protein
MMSRWIDQFLNVYGAILSAYLLITLYLGKEKKMSTDQISRVQAAKFWRVITGSGLREAIKATNVLFEVEGQADRLSYISLDDLSQLIRKNFPQLQVENRQKSDFYFRDALERLRDQSSFEPTVFILHLMLLLHEFKRDTILSPREYLSLREFESALIGHYADRTIDQ